MEEKRCDDDDDDDDEDPLLGKVDLIQEILVRLPVVSLLRFKSVSKSWCALIQTSSFIHLHTTTFFNSSKFGSFIFLASLHKYLPNATGAIIEHSLILLSSGSESVSETESVSESVDCWWSTTGSNDQDDQPDDDQEEELLEEEEEVLKVDNVGGSNDQQVFKVVDNLGRGSSSSNDEQQQLVFKLDSLGFPTRYKSSCCYIGSCNGLVCLYDRNSTLEEFFLWNPATRQFRILPKTFIPSTDDLGPLSRVVAFGFDVETKDYKVVLLTGFRPEFYRPVSPIRCLCRVQVYSLSTNSWRLLKGINSLPGDPFRYPTEVVYLNGSCFFMAHFLHTKQQPCIPENDRFVISFDLTKEIITPIQLPDHHQDQDLYLSCLDDNLALFTKSREYEQPPIGTLEIRDFYEDYNIWMLNEHVSSSSSSVKKESWKNFRSFKILLETPCEHNIPRGISNDGEFALLQIRDSIGLGKKMKLYNLVTKEVKIFLSCSMIMSKAIAYKPSLVSIIAGNGSISP